MAPSTRSRFEFAITSLSIAFALTACHSEAMTPPNTAQPPQTSNASDSPNSVSGDTYYVDCSRKKNGDGTRAAPFNALSSVNALALVPGDRVLFRRGSTCYGELRPTGSGSSAAPIVVDAYGFGPQPVIDQKANPAHDEAILLSDQEYWEIRNLEIIGGYTYGILVAGSAPNRRLHHFHFVNLNLHGTHNHGGTSHPFLSGEISIYPQGVHEVTSDVLIDGVEAHDSPGKVGIWISVGGHYTEVVAECQRVPTPPRYLGSDIVVRNSTVYNISGAGIIMAFLNNGLMEDNVVYNTGVPRGDNGGVSMWEQCAHTATIQNNEAYLAHTTTPYDGGDFDIDLYNDTNILQYNYGHDADGYCIGTVGDTVAPDESNTVRYNVCSNNARNATIAPEGEINCSGAPGVNHWQIYNNTFYFNPAIPSAAFIILGDFHLKNGVIKNNIIYSTQSQMMQIVAKNFRLDNNIYWAAESAGAPSWQWNRFTYVGLPAFQAGTGQDEHSFNSDPMLVSPTYHGDLRPTSAFTLKPNSPARGTGANLCKGVPGCSMGKRDFFGNPLPDGRGYDIGADQAPR
ncbi:MAG: right-handed parallel beta-helix repeat-containing protein [Candidatus Eremiobacteraeota bacterium]|nr:right-handed parallel beta-helix repeat-containing protein [Candidatus Eremiobacteraeota bacterium]